jgi:hypothetical protein
MVGIPELTIVSECENPKTTDNEASSYSLQFCCSFKIVTIEVIDCIHYI